MTDKELLEYAAKAAGIEFTFADGINNDPVLESGETWNPLTDDGDALRLAVDIGLGVSVVLNFDIVKAWHLQPNDCVKEYLLSDKYSATRRAIVRAAAEIGKEMK